MNNKTLLVGCGGSGITTLLRLNELLAGNREMRQRIKEDVSYFVVDTEEAKVKNFKDAIKGQMGTAGLPAMRDVQITSGLVDLDEIVIPAIDQQSNPDALALLKQYWWCAPDNRGRAGNGRAFRAIAQSPITDGAGQVPPIAFLTAWKYLPEIGEKVTSLLEDIQRRNSNDEHPLEKLKVYIVAGLAGGTGRGCWNLIAFKIRQCLREFGVTTDPVGVFFDATCFADRWEGSPGEKGSLMMNSLTGMSELSAWMRMMKVPPETYRFSLPNLEKPDVTGKWKDLEVSGVKDKERAPVNAAFLVFGQNGHAKLVDHEQYQFMSAAALYSLVAADMFIGSNTVNLPESVRSFAATTFEVETIKIRNYMSSVMYEEYGRRLSGGGKEQDKEADGLAGSWRDNPKKESFFGKTGLYVSRQVQADSWGTGGASKTILQVVMSIAETYAHYDEITDKKTNKKKRQFKSWEPIRAALAKQKEDLAQIAAKKGFDDVRRNVTQILNECEAAFSRAEIPLDQESIGRALREFVRSSFYREGVQDKELRKVVGELEPSVSRARRVVSILREAFRESRENVGGTDDKPLSIKVGDKWCEDSDACEKAFKEKIHSKADRKPQDFFMKFSKKEIDELGQEYDKHMHVALFFHVQDFLKEKFKRALDVLEALDHPLETLELALGDVAEEFSAQMCVAFKQATPTAVFDELFIDDDDEKIYQSLPKSDSANNSFCRILKPIISDTELSALVASPGINKKPLVDRLKVEFDNLIGGDEANPYATPEEARISIRNAFMSLVRNNLSLPSVNGMDFMSAHFSFAEVLRRNVPKWSRVLTNRWGTDDSQGEIMDRLRNYLGIEEQDLALTTNAGRTEVSIQFNPLVKNITLSMIKTCVPWIQLKGGASMKYLSTIALLPIALNDKTDKKETWENDFKTALKDKRTMKICHRGDQDGGNRLPNDRLIVFSATGIILPKEGDRNPFQFIASLDYWKKEAFLAPLLQNAEKKTGEGYFEWMEDTRGKGFWAELDRPGGYVSPLFLTQEDLAGRRWRPWKPASEDFDALDQCRYEAKAALLYGLLGSGLEANSEAIRTLRDKGWDGFPLLSMTGKGKGAEKLVFKRQCMVDELAWKKGEVLGATLEKALDVLMGVGSSDDEAKTKKAKSELKRRGDAMRTALLQEKTAFLKKFCALDSDKRNAIHAALGRYLANQAQGHRRNPELWEELYRAWEAEPLEAGFDI